MAKNPPASPAVKRSRGRPPKPGGRLPQVEIQRAYRARLAAAGKVVRLVDTTAAGPEALAALPPSIPDFDPARDGIYEREAVERTGERLHQALLRLENLENDFKRLEQRNAYLEGELKLLERHHTNALKEKILLKQQLAEKEQKQSRKKGGRQDQPLR
jgi:hypothetical protein